MREVLTVFRSLSWYFNCSIDTIPSDGSIRIVNYMYRVAVDIWDYVNGIKRINKLN